MLPLDPAIPILGFSLFVSPAKLHLLLRQRSGLIPTRRPGQTRETMFRDTEMTEAKEDGVDDGMFGSWLDESAVQVSSFCFVV